MIFEHIEWDETNLNHATVRATAAEIEQAIWNADRMTRHREGATACCSGPRLTVVGVWWLWRRSSEMVSDRSRPGRRSDDQVDEGND